MDNGVSVGSYSDASAGQQISFHTATQLESKSQSKRQVQGGTNTMKKVISFIVIIFLVLSMFVSAVGCVDPKPSYGRNALSIVVQGTGNVSGTDYSLLEETIYYTIRGYGYISVVNADGCSEVVYHKSYDIDEQYKSASTERLDADAKTNAANLISALKNGVVADDPELDLLDALRCASLSLSSLSEYDSKTIAVFSSGLSTSGLDLRKNLLTVEPQLIVDMLVERQEIPSFEGMHIVWFLLDPVSPQEPVRGRMRNRLIDLWKGIVEAGGGTWELVESLPIAAPDRDYPMISTVSIPAELPIDFTVDTPVEVDDVEETLPAFSVTEESIGFLPNKSEFRDSSAAMEILKPLAEKLIQNPHIKILLVGCTAGDNQSSWALELSFARASAVMQLLVSLGVDANRITCCGLGCQNPWHIPDVGVNSPLSAQNRRVVILDSRDDTAVEIMANHP